MDEFSKSYKPIKSNIEWLWDAYVHKYVCWHLVKVNKYFIIVSKHISNEMAYNNLIDEVKFRLLTPESFEETLTLMIDHFFPNVPISQCLTVFQNKIDPKFDLTRFRRKTIGKLIKACPLTMIAQDKNMKGKVVGVLIAGLVQKYDKEGRKNEYYDLELSNKEYIE